MVVVRDSLPWWGHVRIVGEKASHFEKSAWNIDIGLALLSTKPVERALTLDEIGVKV